MNTRTRDIVVVSSIVGEVIGVDASKIDGIGCVYVHVHVHGIVCL